MLTQPAFNGIPTCLDSGLAQSDMHVTIADVVFAEPVHDTTSSGGKGHVPSVTQRRAMLVTNLDFGGDHPTNRHLFGVIFLIFWVPGLLWLARYIIILF